MKVVVLGAGYAGVVAANRLARRGFDVLLVNPRPYFVERIRLHRVAAGHRPHARIPFTRILHPAIRMITDEAVRIDPSSRTVELAASAPLAYDWLVLATGSDYRGGEESQHAVVNEHSATRLSARLVRRTTASVHILGAGLTGVETAAALATAGHDVSLVSRAPWPDDAHHRAQRKRIDALGVTFLIAQRGTACAEQDIVVDCTGLRVPPLAATSGLPVDDHGRLLVEPTLQSVAYPNILGAGDAVFISAPTAGHLRMSCATALPMGSHAADTIATMHVGRTPALFRHGYVVQCVDLGRRSGRVQWVSAHDEPRSLALSSWLGGLGKELVVRGTVATMRHARR